MRGLCVYIKAGKGHYVPAKAVHEQLLEIGVDSELADFFSYLDLDWMEKLNQGMWRLMLRIPFLEEHLFRSLDRSGWGIKLVERTIDRLRRRKLSAMIAESRPDFIFATHPYPGTVLSTMLHDMGEDIPVYFYSTDVFSAPVVSICPYLRKFLIPTEEGAESVAAMGQDPDSIMLCPFPLQQSVADRPRLSKHEARRKIGLKEDAFTIQLNLGGEGLGSLSLLEDILAEDLPVQIVIIGGIRKDMEGRIRNVMARYVGGKSSVEIRGFVDNVSEYLAASDVIVGRAGINTIVEAIYAHRPFLITELVYIVTASAEYIEKYGVGWNAAGDREKQIGIIRKLVNEPSQLDVISSAFDAVPIEYSARHLAEMVVSDALSYARKS